MQWVAKCLLETIKSYCMGAFTCGLIMKYLYLKFLLQIWLAIVEKSYHQIPIISYKSYKILLTLLYNNKNGSVLCS